MRAGGVLRNQVKVARPLSLRVRILPALNLLWRHPCDVASYTRRPLRSAAAFFAGSVAQFHFREALESADLWAPLYGPRVRGSRRLLSPLSSFLAHSRARKEPQNARALAGAGRVNQSRHGPSRGARQLLTPLLSAARRSTGAVRRVHRGPRVRAHHTRHLVRALLRDHEAAPGGLHLHAHASPLHHPRHLGARLPHLQVKRQHFPRSFNRQSIQKAPFEFDCFTSGGRVRDV